MDALPFETPEFTALLDECEVWLESWQAQYRAAFAGCFGCTVQAMYANLANGLLVAGARAVVGQLPARDDGRALRHAGYSDGTLKAPRRETRTERINRECRALGLQGAA